MSSAISVDDIVAAVDMVNLYWWREFGGNTRVTIWSGVGNWIVFFVVSYSNMKSCVEFHSLCL